MKRVFIFILLPVATFAEVTGVSTQKNATEFSVPASPPAPDRLLRPTAYVPAYVPASSPRAIVVTVGRVLGPRTFLATLNERVTNADNPLFHITLLEPRAMADGEKVVVQGVDSTGLFRIEGKTYRRIVEVKDGVKAMSEEDIQEAEAERPRKQAEKLNAEALLRAKEAALAEAKAGRITKAEAFKKMRFVSPDHLAVIADFKSGKISYESALIRIREGAAPVAKPITSSLNSTAKKAF